MRLKLVPGEKVSVVDQLELSGMYIDYRAKEQLADRKAMARHPFHEDSFVFQVILREKQVSKLSNIISNSYAH